MAERILPANLLRDIEAIERRVRILESTPRLPQVSTFAAGPVFAQVPVFETTQSTSWTDLATPGPEVTVVVGETRRVIVTAGAYIVSTVDNQTVRTGLSIDGGEPLFWAAVENITGGPFGVSAAHSELIEHGQSWAGSPLDLLPGEHTFKLRYEQSLPGPNDGHFDLRYLSVQPY